MTSYNHQTDYKKKYLKYKKKYMNIHIHMSIKGGSLNNSDSDQYSKSYISDRTSLINALDAYHNPLNGNGAMYNPTYDTYDSNLDKNLKIFQKAHEIRITIKEPWFSYIKAGKKTIEGRINKGLFRQLQPGKNVIFTNGYDQVKVKIIGKNEYSSFEEMLKKESLGSVLPNIKSIQEGVNIYRQYFTEDVEKQYGVVALKLSRN